jgi:hypothetical protein
MGLGDVKPPFLDSLASRWDAFDHGIRDRWCRFARPPAIGFNPSYFPTSQTWRAFQFLATITKFLHFV